MKSTDFLVRLSSAFFAVGLAVASTAIAQPTTDPTLPASHVATSKADAKAQRKAEKQVRRAQKNAELNKLEKNGYNPARDQTHYPQNYQDAQRKADAQQTKPASAP